MGGTETNGATIDAWIARGAIPFDPDDDAALAAAVDRLMADLGGGVELLGFGEALHGGEEILTLRNRIFRRLVSAHGFGAIAIESSFPRSRIVDEYVAGRGPDSYDAIEAAGFGPAFGPLAANRELVEWMRAYNADPARRGALHFYGFDIPGGTIGIGGPGPTLGVALDYLDTVAPAIGRARRARIAPHLRTDAEWENPAAILDYTRSIGASADAAALRIETEELIAWLRAERPGLVAGGGGGRYADALLHATTARELLTFHAAMARDSDNAERLGIRDALMADILVALRERERARGAGRLLVFAHNSHVRRGRAEWRFGDDVQRWWPAGAQLDALLGPRYAVIGTALGVSAENGIAAPEPGTLEARLTATPGPARLIPTGRGRGLPAGGPGAPPARSGSVRNPTYFPLDAAALADFDWLAVLDTATYQRGGPSLDDWGAPPAAEG